MATDPCARSIRPRLHRVDVAAAYDVLDGAQLLELPRAEGRRLGHRRRDRAVDAQHDAGVLQPQEQVRQRRRRPGRLHHVGDHAEVDGGIGLDQRPVEHPRVARPHPADRVGVHAARQQPDAGVGRGLARADDDVLARGLLESHEVVDRDHPRAVGDLEPRRRLRRDVGGEVARVDDPAPLRHLEPLTRDARDEGAVAEVLAAGEELDPARRQHPVRQHVVVVGADRRAGRRARAAPPRARAAGSARRRAPSTRRRRRSTTGAAARTGRPRASGRRRRGDGRRGRRARRRGRSARR